MFRFLPLAYLAGIHGFALFAPYLALFLTLGHLLQRAMHQRMKPKAVPVRPVNASMRRSSDV